jgi:tetratricopeptide (TPR) repeat protein
MAVDREALVRSAEKYVQRGKIDAAIKEYRKVLAEYPSDANTLNRVGDLYARLEKFDEAVKFFTQIAEQYTKDGFFVKAIAIYKKIIKLDPTSLAVYERLAELYWRQGLINEARTQYQVLADYYTRHSNATSAITIYQKMAEVEPENPSYRLKLAELYQSQRLFEKSLREYRALADLLLVAGQVDETVQVYSKAFELVGESLDFVREAVAGLHEAGHAAAASRLLARATELNPKAVALGQQIGLRPPGQPEPPAPVRQPEPEPEPEPFEEPAYGGASFAESAFGESAGSSFDAGPSFGSGPSFEVEPTFGGSPSFDSSPGFGSPSSYSGYGGGGSFGGFDEPVAPAKRPGESTGGLKQEAIPLDEEFSFDLESDEEPESLVKPPADIHLTGGREAIRPATRGPATGGPASGRAGEDAEVDVGEFAFEIDLDAESEPLPYASSPGRLGAAGAGAAGTGSPGSAVEIEWGDPMADLDLALPPPDDEPVVATDLRKMARTPPPAPPAEDGYFEFDVDLEETAAVAQPAPPAPAVSPPDRPTQQPFSLSLDDDEEEEAYSIDLEATAGVYGQPPAFDEPAALGQSSFEVELDESSATLMAVPPAASRPPAAQTKVATQPRPAIPPLLPEPEAEAEDEEDDLATVRREEDLLAEARVFSKYGLKEKALDRLKDLLRASPAHLEGLTMLTRFDLDAGRYEEVRKGANEVARLSKAAGLPEGEAARWIELKSDLAAAGFGLEGDKVTFLPGEARPVPSRPAVKAGDDRIAQLLEDLSLESFDSAPARERDERQSYQSLLQEAAPEPPAPPAAAPPPEGIVKTSLASLVDELGLDDLDEEEVPAPQIKRPVPHAPAAPRTPDPLDETGMSWLDDVAPAPEVKAAKAPSSSETIFDEEDDFFDLAAELEAELDAVDINDSLITSLQPQEQSLEEIIEGFKQGVAEHLSAEDYDTHFNLGIAYREMGLLDEAIGEFQLSSKDPRYLVESSSMLGICFMEKGLPELAVRWYRKGLESPQISEDVTLGLLYDMGIAYMSLADYDAAYKTFVEIYGMNSNFRDTSGKLQELAPLRQP